MDSSIDLESELNEYLDLVPSDDAPDINYEEFMEIEREQEENDILFNNEQNNTQLAEFVNNGNSSSNNINYKNNLNTKRKLFSSSTHNINNNIIDLENDSMNDIQNSLSQIANSTKPSPIKPITPIIKKHKCDPVSKSEYKPIYLYTRAPINGKSLSITTNSTGERYYLTVEEESSLDNRIQMEMKKSSKSYIKNLLVQPIQQMLRNIEEKETQRAIQKSIDSKKKHNESNTNNNHSEHKSNKKNALWVDKYRPKAFTDLLSPEKLNREVLAWIKEWDQCVFGRVKTEAQLERETQLKEQKRMFTNKYAKDQFHQNNHHNNNNQKGKDTDEHDNRPEHKIILLCGPPGLGKTTLAHILARTAGYRAVEINASDDRGEAELTSKIRAAVEMKSMFGENKPNLLIIDEIDGASGSVGEGDKGAIPALVKIILAGKTKTKKGENKDNNESNEGDDDEDNENEGENEQKQNNNNSTEEKKTGGKGKKAAIPYLKRPIIAICNDQFTSALRPLRAVAKIFVFEKASKQRLIDRLKFICRNEGLLVDDNLLSIVVDLVENDIRQALNTLQFIHNKANNTGAKLTVQILQQLNIGIKDISKSRFEVVDTLFNQKIIQNKFMSNNKENVDNFLHSAIMTSSSNNTNNAAKSNLAATECRVFNYLYNLIDDSESSKVNDTLHWNFLQTNYSDPTYNKTIELCDLFSYVDCYSNHGLSDGELVFEQYQPLIGLNIYYSIAKPRKPLLEMSHSYTYFTLTETSRSILSTFLWNPSNSLRLMSISMRQFVLDCLSSVLDIISPSIRPVNLALLTMNEKAELEQLLDTLISLNLTFKIDNTSLINLNSFHTQSIQNYRLEPPIDSLSKFNINNDSTRLLQDSNVFNRSFTQHQNGIVTNPDRELPNKTKQILLRELEYEIVRRNEQNRKVMKEQGAFLADTTTNNNNSMVSPNGKRTGLTAPNSASPQSSGPIHKPFTKPNATDLVAMNQRFHPDKNKATEEKKKELQPSPDKKKRKVNNFLQEISDKIKSNSMNKARAAAAANRLAITNANNLANQSNNSIVNNHQDVSMKIESSHSNEQNTVHFKFNEGFTQAVRRIVSVSHFM